jgi:hypothetical protein
VQMVQRGEDALGGEGQHEVNVPGHDGEFGGRRR